MNKEELLSIVTRVGGDVLNQDESDDSSGYVDIAIWQLIALKDAILERAAQECENLKWVDGQPIPSNAEFARLVRSLKTKTQD